MFEADSSCVMLLYFLQKYNEILHIKISTFTSDMNVKYVSFWEGNAGKG